MVLATSSVRERGRKKEAKSKLKSKAIGSGWHLGNDCVLCMEAQRPAA
jgi:hypothetical protein